MARARRKLKPGDKLSDMSASTWNELIDVLNWFDSNQGLLSNIRPAEVAPRAGLVHVTNNDTGPTDFAQFDVIGLNDILISQSANAVEFKNHFAFKGVVPTTASHANKFAVLQEPINGGETRMASAITSGITVCRINVGDASHKFAAVTNGDQTQFTSSATGPVTILWKESGTGASKWAVVFINNSPSGSAPRSFYYSGDVINLTAAGTFYLCTFPNTENPTGGSEGSVTYNAASDYWELNDSTQWAMHLVVKSEVVTQLVSGRRLLLQVVVYESSSLSAAPDTPCVSFFQQAIDSSDLGPIAGCRKIWTSSVPVRPLLDAAAGRRYNIYAYAAHYGTSSGAAIDLNVQCALHFTEIKVT